MFDDIPQLADVPEDQIRGKRVFLRASFNVPIKDGEIENDFRIRKALPTITWLRSHGARIIIGSHIWGDEITTLKPVHEYLSKLMDVEFASDALASDVPDLIEGLGEGDVLLLENLRLHSEEQENEKEFAERLAQCADIYVNDAFPVSHRSHASVVTLPTLLPAYAGLRFMEEISNLSQVFTPPEPSVLVIGGAKFESKVPMVVELLDNFDNAYVAGAIANVFLEARGMNMGDSLKPVEEMELGESVVDERLMLPRDVVAITGDEKVVKSVEYVEGKDKVLDIGPGSIDDVCVLAREAGFVLWNGPLGDYEEGFYDSTYAFAKALAESNAVSIVGGGDTIAAISELDLEESYTFVSTAGGAMVEFLLERTLPGIEALRSRKV